MIDIIFRKLEKCKEVLMIMVRRISMTIKIAEDEKITDGG